MDQSVTNLWKQPVKASLVAGRSALPGSRGSNEEVQTVLLGWFAEYHVGRMMFHRVQVPGTTRPGTVQPQPEKENNIRATEVSSELHHAVFALVS